MTSKPGSPGLICLGASAGGLRSLEAIVSRLPADLPWPVLIAQHLQPDRSSQMHEILARVAHMPVREAADGETPHAGTIYTCPSSHEMGVAIDGQITLRSPMHGRPQRIDHLFATASYARPDRTIAVVLSGTGTDGAVGSLVVKLNNGTVLAESDETAQHAEMPAAAQRAGTVDATFNADALAGVLNDLARGTLDEATTLTRATVDKIARLITNPNGTDFEHYRAGTLRRQAEKRRAMLGLKTLDEYHDRVAKDPAERSALVKSLHIPVTQFFRDPPAWRAIEDHVIPLLAKRSRTGRPIRIWCAGCASGEEAYSIAILLAESIAERSLVRITATDVDSDALSSAAQGVFDATHLDGVDALRRERFFHPEGRGYRVSKDLQQLVDFRTHDLTRDEPPGQFDLIICRNVLIYFDDELQARTLGKFHEALIGPRVLFLGRSEANPKQFAGVVPATKLLRIFRASGTRSDEEMHLAPEAAVTPATLGASGWSGSGDIRVEEPDAIVLVVDDAWRILDANDHARALLDSEQLVGTNVFDLFPRWQGSPVQDALRASSETGRSVKVRGAPTPDGPMDITLSRAPRSKRGVLLIGTPALPGGPSAVDPGIIEAREDLAATNDELQSANEELAATNEELQATNEELASLNEEFQSTNQNLASANVELGAVAKTAKAAADLINEFIQTRLEALVACDADQRVTVFNRAAAEMFGLDPSCIGRPVALVKVGLAQADVDAFFERAVQTRLTERVAHGSRELDLTIEHVKAKAGGPLGWVLSWTPRSR